MPAYQIHRLKETQRQQFRWAPHTPGVTIVKLKDYEAGPVVEAATPYALWLALRESDKAIAVGDLIEVLGDVPGGELRILKYIGFEEARWYVPEPAPNAIGEPVAVT
ncbi:MAG: hypothetical protein ABSE57_23255 [Bryobacteraceae bacterium]|jgi:hypothetical protein